MHNRSRLLLVLTIVLSGFGVPWSSADAADRNPHPLVVDPAGDGANFVGTEASPARTDVLAVDVTDSPSNLTFSMHLVDLDDAYESLQDAVNPRSYDDYFFHLFTGPTRFTASAIRDPATGESSFEFYVVSGTGAYSGSHPVPGSFDSATDTLTIEVPTALVQALHPGFGRGTVFTGIQSFARSNRHTISSSATSPVDTADDPNAEYVVGR